MSWERIRPLALGVPRRGPEVFLSELSDPGDDRRFYRPVGGGIEFGESSAEALTREFREELGVGVAVESYCGTIENCFRFDGTPGHEIALVYEVSLPNEGPFPVEGHDDDGTYDAGWVSVDALERGDTPLYPEGVLTVLTEDAGHVVNDG